MNKAIQRWLAKRIPTEIYLGFLFFYMESKKRGDLRKAHKALDKAVDLCYKKKSFENEMERMEYLFGLEHEIFKKAKKDIAIVKKKVEKTAVEGS